MKTEHVSYGQKNHQIKEGRSYSCSLTLERAKSSAFTFYAKLNLSVWSFLSVLGDKRTVPFKAFSTNYSCNVHEWQNIRSIINVKRQCEVTQMLQSACNSQTHLYWRSPKDTKLNLGIQETKLTNGAHGQPSGRRRRRTLGDKDTKRDSAMRLEVSARFVSFTGLHPGAGLHISSSFTYLELIQRFKLHVDAPSMTVCQLHQVGNRLTCSVFLLLSASLVFLPAFGCCDRFRAERKHLGKTAEHNLTRWARHPIHLKRLPQDTQREPVECLLQAHKVHVD